MGLFDEHGPSERQRAEAQTAYKMLKTGVATKDPKHMIVALMGAVCWILEQFGAEIEKPEEKPDG